MILNPKKYNHNLQVVDKNVHKRYNPCFQNGSQERRRKSGRLVSLVAETNAKQEAEAGNLHGVHKSVNGD